MNKIFPRLMIPVGVAVVAATLPLIAQSPSPTPGGPNMPVPKRYNLSDLPPVNQITPPPLPTGSPTPVAPTPTPTPAATPAPTPTPSPTPLPDGTMPLTPPPMPVPALPDASVLDQDFNIPIPEPRQDSEPLSPGGGETRRMQSSEDLAMQQKMVLADFEKSLAKLIAKQRNPKVPDLTLSDAVQVALRQNPEILNAIQQIRLTRGQLIEVVSQAVPQIGVSSGYTQTQDTLNPQVSGSAGRIEIPNPSGGSPTILELPAQNRQSQNQTWNIQFQATQLIFDGGATIAGIRAGDIVYQSAFFSLRSTIDDIVAQVITQFYAVVLNRALIVAQQQNVALLEQQVRDQQNRFEAGTVPRFNVLQAEVALANAKPPLIQAENDYRISLYQLVQLLGMDYPAGNPSEVPFNVVGTLGYSPQVIDTDTSIRIAIARNPALKAQRLNILTQAANVDVQFAGYLPSINANVGYEIRNDTTSSTLTDNLTGWFFGATGTWNIWDGGATYGRVAQAKAQLMQSKNSYDNAVRNVVLDVQEAISNLQQAQETIDSQTASVVQATEALRLARERLDAGAGTQLDVLNAQVQLLQSQTNVLQARYDYIAAMASYELALSLDTQYVETFDDPLVRPLNPQALNKAESRKFEKVTNPDRPQPKLPKKMRADDPIVPILETPGKKDSKPKRPTGLNK